MAEIASLKVNAHRNIYIKNEDKADVAPRMLQIEIGVPDITNENTGLLVFVPGYGGNINSKVFRRMRTEFPDRYNVVTVQCDYFGNRYMGLPERVTIERENYGKVRTVYCSDTGENREEFNDMGIMQALDVVSATVYCVHYCREKKYVTNTNNVILFGTSHGAYIAHLANLICPDLYTWLIDISSYIKPFYLEHTRFVPLGQNPMGLEEVEISYFLKECRKIRYDDRLYDLEYLYQNAENNCKIIAFQGTEDWMVDYRNRILFFDNIGERGQLILVQKEDIDGKLCKSADHGLAMDFFELFRMLMPMLEKTTNRNSGEMHIRETVTLGTDDASMCISYKTGRPELLSITF